MLDESVVGVGVTMIIWVCITIKNTHLSLATITGWWFQPLWQILVTWDDEIPNMMGKS